MEHRYQSTPGLQWSMDINAIISAASTDTSLAELDQRLTTTWQILTVKLLILAD